MHKIIASLGEVATQGSRSRFATDAYWLELPDHGRPLPLAFVIVFDAHAYNPAIFTHLGIKYPLEIQRAVTNRQAEFLAGRLAAREAMCRLGIHSAELNIGPLRQPLWPNGVTGSITHVNSLCAAIAVSSDMVKGIGIDIERTMETSTADAVSDIVLTDEERAILPTKNCHIAPNMLLTIVFSAKESFFKATSSHVGRYFEFHALRLIHFDAAKGRLTFIIAESLSPVLRPGQVFDACFRVIDSQTVLTSFVW